MKTESFDDLVMHRQRRFTPHIKPPKQVIGFDTETKDGKVFIICDSSGRSLWSQDMETCLDFLHHKQYQSTLNVFYNLDYDVMAILKGLSKEQLEMLYTLGKVRVFGYVIKYMPCKMLSLRKGHHVTAFFDMAQFYNMSLQKASEKYLQSSKKEIDVTKFADKGFIDNNRQQIEEYCIHDALLVQQLGTIFQSMCHSIQLDCNRPISCASLSMRYFNRHTSLPILWDAQAMRYGFDAYAGGRFETFQRGYFDTVYSYDIQSAYPGVMKNLLDIQQGSWCLSQTVIPDADIGFIKCRITSKNPLIESIPYKINGLVTFPQLSKTEKVITLDEYHFLQDNHLADIEVKTGCYFYAFRKVYPLRCIQDVYDKRVELKQKGDNLQLVLKIILNSLYGKFLEQNIQWQEVDQPQPTDTFIEYITDEGIKSYKKVIESGNYFNPVYGALITSRVRLQLLSMMLKNPDSVIACYTDSIKTTEKYIPVKQGIGEWSYEGKYEGLLLGNGVYTFKNDKEVKTGLRGFIKTSSFDLIDYLQNNPYKSGVDFTNNKVIKLGQWLQHHNRYKANDLNTFQPYEKQLRLNFDQKRAWQRPFENNRDALHNVILSRPLQVSSF